MDPNSKELVRQGYVEVIRQPYPDQGAEQDFKGGGLLEYWRILQRRRGTVLLIAFSGLLLGILITLPQTPIYQARATLEVQDLNQDFLNMRQVTPVSDAGQSYSALADIQTQIRILQSRTLTERVMAKQKTPPAAPEGRAAAWRKALNLPDAKPAPTLEDRAAGALASLKVRAAGQTRILEILYDSPDPKAAADFVNTLTNEYIDQNMEARWKMSERTGDWLGRQLDEMRIKLERSEDQLQRYARQAGLVFTGEKQNVSEEKLRQIQTELGKATADRVQKQSRFEMAKSSPPEALPDILNDSSLREYQTKLTDLRRQQAEMAATYKPEYSKVKRIEAQIAPIEAALDRERSAIVQRIQNDYDEALRREKLLTADYENQTRQVTGEAERSIQYNILKREVDSNRQLYESMLQRVKESSIASAMRASNVRVVDAAKPPKAPYKPKIAMNALLGLMAGCFLGIALVVIQERADRTIQDPGDSPLYLNVPELGVIPSAEKARHGLYYARGKTSKELVAGARAEEAVELVTWQRKPSMAAEAFRVVLTSIMFSGENGGRPKVLVLTSASPKEGKSTVASNLAIAMAQVKQRTLLIDADLRKPRQHEIFELKNDTGLSEILGGEEVANGVVQETKIPGLFVLPAGNGAGLAANLLFSKAMPELLAKFRKEFEMVVIDTPPMLQMPDARVLGRLADAVVLVVRTGVTTRDAAMAARQRFTEDQTRVLGTILNDWDPKRSPGGYYGYYSGYYPGYKKYYAGGSHG